MESQNERVPADGGVSSLGLLMQLGGSVFAALTTLITFFMLFAMRATMPGGRTDAMWIFIILGLCVGRSMFHRMAGAELLYGRRTGFDSTTPESPLTGLRRYILVGLVHSALVALIFKMKFDGDTKHILAIALGLAAWPATLLALLATGRFRSLQHEVPVSEDKGFEGAAILMTVLGLCGVLGNGTVLVLFLNEGTRALSGASALLLVAMVMLFIRSCLHLQAGLSGLRETSLDRSVELANRYANFGVISAFCAGGAMLFLSMTESFNVMSLVVVTGVCWLLMAWPMIVRRFFSDRQFADLLSDNATVHRRSPDAGLTGLGWLLVGHALYCASTLIPRLVDGGDSSSMMERTLMSLGGLPVGLRSDWWIAGVVVFQLWAGIELVKMTKLSRYIASAFAVVATVVGLYVCWPMIEEFKMMKEVFGAKQSFALLGPVAIQFVIPVATLLLVNRQIAPTARARFRSRSV